jgi:hypothetical protein
VTNETFWKLNREWAEQEAEHETELMRFLEREYPRVFKYMNTRDAIGFFPLTPLPYDMRVILKHWQETHEPIVYRVSRVCGKRPSFSYL